MSQERIDRERHGGHERIPDDISHGRNSKCVAHDDKTRPTHYCTRKPNNAS